MIKPNHTTNIPSWHRICAFVIAVLTACSPALGATSTPTIPGFYGAVPGFTGTSTLPQGGAIRSGVGSITQTPGNMVINQDSSQLAIDWEKFNIAPGSVVTFNQRVKLIDEKTGNQAIDKITGQLLWTPQPQWAALNRIYSADASQIYGSIKADGKVYLINSNGILFGPGSTVDVHSLIASNLNITDQNFENGKLRFTTDSTDPYYKAQGPLDNSKGFVFNYGNITTDSSGTVALIGPNVVNAGIISAPSGKISLIGAQQKDDGTTGWVETDELTVDATGNDLTYSDLQVPGTAYNAVGGELITKSGGRINMYGATVQNDGMIRAVTAFKKGGVVILAARDKVTTGLGSSIESLIDPSINPETGKPETADPQYSFYHPEIILQGLYTDGNSQPNALSNIEHQGTIVAPSGKVQLTAKDKIYLSDNSKINVAGLWLDRAASANLLEVQLNSVDLRDDYGQKDGTLLGEKIYVDVLTGSNIGNLKNNYLTMQSGAEERSTRGGSIKFGDSSKNIVPDQLIIKQGSELDFSGGGIRYATGTMATSRLISGNKLYDLGSAPQSITYDRLADSQTRTHQRFGITEKFKGLYFGGGSSVQDLTAARVVGSDAGSATFVARIAALDGTLKGIVLNGQYQTNVSPNVADRNITSSTTSDGQNYLVSKIRGLEEAVGGTVTVGNMLAAAAEGSGAGGNEQDFVTNAITVKSTTTPLAAIVDDISGTERTTTEISSELLNSAGLSALNLFANTTIKTESGAELSLLPGGSYVARARRIDFDGSIEIAGGSVEMTTRPNISSYESLLSKSGVNLLYEELTELVYLASGSSISTAGQRIVNSAAGMALHPVTSTGHTAGGTILIQERTEEGTSANTGTTSEGHSVVVAAGAVLDVSGGWLIDSKGKISGGNAGTLDLKGSTLSLAGELRGYSLPGKTGGEIKLHAGEVQVTSRDLVLPSNVEIDATIPDYLLGKLVLGEDRLKDTGFSRISLTAINDITFSDGAVLTPSLTKLSMPVPAIVSQAATVGNTVVPAGSDSAVAEYLGSTRVTVTAGKNIYENSPLADGKDSVNSAIAKIDLQAGTGITVAPGGSITLAAPYIDIAGQIEALGGNVTVSASQPGDSFVVETGGRILAGGYNKPVTTTVAGLPAGSSPQAGGTVTLTSTGNVVLEAGSKVDVSGSAPVERLVADSDGTPVKVVVAGDPGTLNLSYSGSLTLDGEIDGAARIDGSRGGTLSVTNSRSDLKILAADINRYQSSGFDALTFTSTIGALVFTEDLKDVTVGRHLTLDGASIKGEQDVDVVLSSPWITVKNTPNSTKSPASGSATAGTANLSLLAEGADKAGGFLDVAGSIRMDGFSEVTLQAGRDLRLLDFKDSDKSALAGDLRVSGNLTMTASRIYPTTSTDFTISTPGKVTILPGVTDAAPVYSAGGSLTIAAAGGIEQRGTLAAPLGNITLIGGTKNTNGTYTLSSSVDLTEGNIITAGSVPVRYGSYNGSTWTTRSEPLTDGSIQNFGSDVTAAPTSSVILKGKEVIVGQNASIDVSGGGSVFASNFQSGIQGTRNPLASTSGRFVILPDNSVKLPGAAVYLDAVPSLGLKAGIYSLLPADSYAHVSGALVVQDAGMQLVAGQKALSTQGYQVVAGYGTITDTAISSQAYKGYSIRSAADVIKEGDFTDQRSFVAGNGGNLSLTATSAALNGTLNAQPLQGYQGGVLTLSAKNVIAQSGAALSEVPTADTLIVNTASVKGFGEVALGGKEYDSTKNEYTYTAETVTVKNGSMLTASSVTLQAKNSVTVENGAVVEALGGSNGGVATVDVPAGALYLNENSLIHSKNDLRLNVGGMLLQGDFKADNGSLSLTANNIVFANDTYVQPTDVNGVPQDVYLTEKNWSSTSTSSTNLSNYSDLTLASRGDMLFQRNVDMKAKGALTLDAGRYAAASDVNVSFAADSGKLTLLNSGTAPDLTKLTSANNSTLTLSGSGIDISPRNGILFDQFGTVTLNSSGDVTLRGAGTVTTAKDLNINAPKVTTSSYKYDADSSVKTDVSIPYTAADITINTGGNVIIAGNGGTAGTTSTPGGSLEIMGAMITVGDNSINPVDNSKNKYATVLEAASGQVKLTASGDIKLLDNASILATGSKSKLPMQDDYSYTPAGSIALESSSGAVVLAEGSTLDVHSDQGDAGSVKFSAASGGVEMSGAIKGSAANGQGGSFAIDSATLGGAGGLDGLSTTLTLGGFNDKINIRSRSGDLSLAADKTLTGREVVIAADTSTKPDGTKNNDGSIDISGTIKASGVKDGDTGGRVELYAQNNLTVSGSIVAISAQNPNSGASGGEVLLASESGSLALKNGLIDVSGGLNKGIGGSVHLRALRDDTVGVKMNLNAEIRGASEVVAEAFKVYDTNTTTTTVTTSNPSTTNTTTTNTIIALNAVNTSTTKDGVATTVTSDSVIDKVMGDASAYMVTADVIRDGLLSSLIKPDNWDPANTEFHFRPGVEIRGGNVDLSNTAWDLTTGRYYSGRVDASGTKVINEPGVVTLRATGNLNINANLVDAPTAMANLYSKTTGTIGMQPSWGINLVAGADANAANYKAVVAGTGDLNIAGGKTVYTENAPINFAAGNDVNMMGTTATNGPGYMINNDMKYNLGSYGGTVRGVVGNDLNLEKSGSAIQTALGDIDIKVGGDLNLGSAANTGAIRTTGEYDNSAKVLKVPGMDENVLNNWVNSSTTSYWTYGNGGSINLDVGGSVAGNLIATNGWDGAYTDPSASNFDKLKYTWYLAAGFGGSKENAQQANIPVTVGIATMGGGDVSVKTGGSLLTQIGAFGTRDTGDLTVTSGGDMTGRFRAMNGTAILTSGGGFGKDDGDSGTLRSVIEMGAAQVNLAAQGDVHLGSVLNPDNSRDRIFVGGDNKWNMTYTTNSSASISSLVGNVTFYDTDSFAAYDVTNSSPVTGRNNILPASFTLAAAKNLNIRNDFYLAPSTNGNLGLYAGGNISGTIPNKINAASFRMVDVDDVDSFYKRQADAGSMAGKHFVELSVDPSLDTPVAYWKSVNHQYDTVVPVTVKTGEDIDTLKLVLNKKAKVTADGDINNLNFVGQNNSVDSVTLVSAQGSINQGILSTNLSEIVVGGPGTLLVAAGKDINLGNSKGIQSVGNKFNSFFTGDNTDSAIIVSAGAKQSIPTTLVSDYFAILLQAGDDYTNLKAAGENEAALGRIEDARIEIRKYFDEPNSVGDGSINMIKSLIRSKKGDIYLMARGDVNVGGSDVSDSAGSKTDTGISTTFGGKLNIYTGGDLNVNESRTMTFMGGDIVIWSDQGDVKAGRGSKTALSGSNLGVFEDRNPETHVLKGLLYPAPSVGSGIRCSTYDPDGSTGPMMAPMIGNPSVFTPNGIIDAGEAGIAGGKVTLGALQVLNAQNISFSSGSVGVPSQSSSVSLGALGGNSSMTDSSKMIETASSGGGTKDKAKQRLAQAADDFLSKFLDVKVLGFDMDTMPASDKDTPEDLKKGKKKK